jgi:hypothetical protein
MVLLVLFHFLDDMLPTRVTSSLMGSVVSSIYKVLVLCDVGDGQVMQINVHWILLAWEFSASEYMSYT